MGLLVNCTITFTRRPAGFPVGPGRATASRTRSPSRTGTKRRRPSSCSSRYPRVLEAVLARALTQNMSAENDGVQGHERSPFLGPPAESGHGSGIRNSLPDNPDGGACGGFRASRFGRGFDSRRLHSRKHPAGCFHNWSTMLCIVAASVVVASVSKLPAQLLPHQRGGNRAPRSFGHW